MSSVWAADGFGFGVRFGSGFWEDRGKRMRTRVEKKKVEDFGVMVQFSLLLGGFFFLVRKMLLCGLSSLLIGWCFFNASLLSGRVFVCVGNTLEQERRKV